ncbi:hypothetical protein GCM10010145_02140 [Streptomyces ruber]|uniref:Uncharacterized protein n=2 Tax=Streptomyces TaxID=1883 RepID=A0A918EN43_9ACTN|nr:hypothetical protein [Streptomyces ruber]GGQ38399.1 hypothetical protein GCM10010145_02140 [Streptomyces ruber]
MRPAPHAVPTGGRRLAAAFTTLLAVLLTLVPTAGPHTVTAGPLPAAAATAPAAHPLGDTDRHADDAGATAQPRAVRHDHLGERPSPADHHATTASHGPAVPAAGARTPPPDALPAVSPGRTAHDRGRAPPAPPGT